MHKGRFAAQFTDLKKLTTDELGEYMLGLKVMAPEEMGDLF